MKKSVRNFIKIYWEVLLVVAAGIAGVILLKVKGEDWPAALNFPTEAVAAGYWILILGMTALEGILIFRFLVKGLEYVIYTVAAMALPYVCLARRTAFPKPDLDIQFGDPDRPACDADKVQAKKTGPAVFSSVIYDMY